MGDIACGDGMPRTAGRILGYLLMSPEPVAFCDLVEVLQISRGGTSENTRFLERHGILERIHHRADRRDFYRIRQDACDAMATRATGRALASVGRLCAFRSRHELSSDQQERIIGVEMFIGTQVSPCPVSLPQPANRQSAHATSSQKSTWK